MDASRGHVLIDPGKFIDNRLRIAMKRYNFR